MRAECPIKLAYRYGLFYLLFDAKVNNISRSREGVANAKKQSSPAGKNGLFGN
jgi:hypothetical protein